jgi:hypothetical protein
MEPVVATVVRGYKEVHAKLRDAVRGLDAAALNWKPAAETNSIAVLVVHTLGSEAEVLRVASNTPTDRDRDAEFLSEADSADELIRRLDAGDALLDELAPRITAADLDAVRARGNREAQEVRWMLVANYGHAREHQAHIELTKQLLAAQWGSRAAG